MLSLQHLCPQFKAILLSPPLLSCQVSELCTQAFPVLIPILLEATLITLSTMEAEQLCIWAGGNQVCLCKFCFILVFPVTALGL